MPEENVEPTATEENPESAQTKEIDWKAEARKHESRARENKAALDKLTEDFTNAQKELERWKERETGWNTAKEETEKSLSSLKSEATRYKVAFTSGLTAEQLDALPSGLDEEQLTKLATAFSTLNSSKRPAPNPEQGKRSEKSPKESLAAEIRSLWSD